ncbi:hypothetical protein GRI62_00485 [Erythrobacter arachoides]|uniref:Uncharacterized protein n=1 Tax=Aurantiacibacter arachoides TaxID=1850444 RepID=A0A844ZXW2_9SPHN|nr:hypothetical protein [Aurantiacibacter arachoides]MXO92082.1 hypothetical protein [Aurantiacibacter arachoides]GGD59923.1 hypothetical protein GCM10011411_20080 [Aurantiacibacter arachoides]
MPAFDNDIHRRAVPPRAQQPGPVLVFGEIMQQNQQRGVQTQKQSQGQSDDKSGSESRETNPAQGSEGERARSPSTEGPSTEGPVADDADAGSARPVYDQYEVNTPQTMQQDEAAEAMKREQAGANDGDPRGKPGDNPEGKARNADGSQGLGYGAQDGEEMADAPDATRPRNGYDTAE